MKIFSLQKLLFLALFLGMGTSLFAQPANDDCSTPSMITLAVDEASSTQVPGDTRGTVDATTVVGPSVCSGSWFTDDVWYSFTVGATVPVNGVTVRTYFTGTGTDLPDVGMAVYSNDCSDTNTPFECFTDEPGRTDLLVRPQCMMPGETYLVRVWSAGDPTANAGTFMIAAFDADPPPVNTEVVIWSEGFNTGLGDWTTTFGPNTTDTTDVWLWDESGTFPNAFGGTVTINSPTSSCSGAVGFPSGWLQTGMTGDVTQVPPGPPYPARSAMLISPAIDCSNSTAVACKFTSAFRGLNGSGNTNLGAIFDYSIDGGQTWSIAEDPSAELEINEAYDGLESRFSLAGAGGQSDVRIRFTFEGDFYYWLLDDIRVIEPEAHNLRVNPFFAIPNNAQTPASQVDGVPFRGLADIQNIGGAEQTNVKLNLSVADANGSVVYSEDLDYTNVAADETVENVPFGGAYTLSTTPGVYTGTYTISADSSDFDIADNARSFSFEVTDSVYAKETGRTRAVAPAGTIWDAGAPHSWAMGNVYHISNGTTADNENVFLSSVSFGITNPEDIPGQSLAIWLYRWDNANDNDIAEEGERTRVGFNLYTVTGTEPAEVTITIPLQDFVSDSWPIFLEDDTDYIVMVEYVAPDDQVTLFFEASEDFDYGAQVFMNSPLPPPTGLQIDEPRWGPITAVPPDGSFASGVDYNLSFFGSGIVTTTRMHLGAWPVSTTEILSDDNTVNVFPNPAKENITLELGLVETATDAVIRIVDIAGRTVFTQQYDNLQNDILEFDVSAYANGTYFLNVATEVGTKTQKFTVQH